MDIPYVRGRVAHAGPRRPARRHRRGGVRAQRLLRPLRPPVPEHPPVAWTRIDGPLRPRLYDLGAVAAGDYLAARVAAAGQRRLRVLTATLAEPMPYLFRNADGDELLFVHAGAGRLETDFGPLAYEPGDYLVIPRGTAYRLAPTSETRLLVVETTGELAVPDRGMLGQHALFDPAVIKVPSPGEASTLTAGQAPARHAASGAW
jgi:homogentisate 1,2-dioxygenase